MKNGIKIIPAGTRLSGHVTPPASKSQSHRLIIAAALAQGESCLSNLSHSQDIDATLRCMEALGARIHGGVVTGLTRGPWQGELPRLDCGESGSTLRFLLPVALAVAGGGVFTGHGRLLARPMEPYELIFREKGIDYQATPEQILLRGKLTPGTYRLPGNVSSQFITGLLYGLSLLEGDSEIQLLTPLESAAYVDMTLAAMERFGVRIQPTGQGWLVPGGQRYQARSLTVEGDWSQAAFFQVARFLGNPVEVQGMDPRSCQGDKIILPYLERLRQPGPVELDLSQCPDLGPALALAAALRWGEETRLVNAGRLRMKESDRIDTVTEELNKLGAKVIPHPDAMTIYGVRSLRGGTVDGHNDHRVAMMLAIAATRATGEVVLQGPACVDKSYPAFWAHYDLLRQGRDAN